MKFHDLFQQNLEQMDEEFFCFTLRRVYLKYILVFLQKAVADSSELNAMKRSNLMQ